LARANGIMSPLETIAFVVSVLGVWLTTARSLWNYPFSLLSVALYGVIFFRVKLYADMTLQGIFALTLLYGLSQWLRGRGPTGEVQVTRVNAREIALSLILGGAAAVGLGYGLETRTDASLPWADSLLLAGSLIGSVWAARRRLESWWVWIIVDVLYVGVYLLKHLYLTSVLYAAFVVLAVIGLRRWSSAFDKQVRAAQATATAPVDAPITVGGRP
jgi:nicotinamide mononucleotide transporter